VVEKKARMVSWLKYCSMIWLLAFASLQGEEVCKKKILVLCSNGGNGHNAAVGALKTILHERYEFTVVYPIDELEMFGVQSGEGLYNLFLQKGWTRSVNFVSRHVAPKVFRSYKKKIEGLIANHIETVEPDLVVSVIPFINFYASEAARKATVPFLMITTDNDLQTFVHGLQGVSHPNFKVVVGTHLPCSQEMLHQKNIADNLIEVIGLPVRPDFLVKKDAKLLREKYQIPAHMPVILIMIGGAGGDATYQYAKTLGQIQMGVHLIACAGRNKEMADDMRKIKLNRSNSLTVMEFTDQIPELMTIADLIITKPGTLSTTESLAMQLPILMDCTNPVIDWEQANIDLIKNYGVGNDIKELKHVEMLVRDYLYDTELRYRVQQAYQKMPANRFNESIAGVIDEMCTTKNL
jgi:processive 1,2-diacylglycerol beta-glucosyltransferase